MLARVALLALTIPLIASAQGVSGRWTATFDSDISRQRDTFVVKSRRQAALELTQRSDSVFGTWKVDNIPTANVRGTFDGHTLRLTTGIRDQEVRIDGKPSVMKTRTDWSGSVQGSRIDGAMFIQIGDRDASPRKWEAQRSP